jgi:endonuclease/exonuclease/phosphatase family metal-dependent hydrolase
MRTTGALLVLAVGLAAAPAAAQPVRPLTFVTFNLFHGGPGAVFTGDDRALDRRLAMVARELRALDADVVGLQEASAGRGRGVVAERLARELGYQWAFAPGTASAVPFLGLGHLVVWLMGFSEGPALLSRFPIARHEVHLLPRCRKFFDPRVLLRAEVTTPWGPLPVFSTHTSHDDCQVRHVAEVVRRHRGGAPSVVMGDFNATEQAPWMADLRQAGFVDAFRAANPDTPGHTVWQRVDAPSATVFRRVDYVFVVPGERTAGRVLQSRVVLDTPGRAEGGGPLWPSDHYGVLARVSVFPDSSTAREGGKD